VLLYDRAALLLRWYDYCTVCLRCYYSTVLLYYSTVLYYYCTTSVLQYSNNYDDYCTATVRLLCCGTAPARRLWYCMYCIVLLCYCTSATVLC
jgi:hypothetical protein